VKAEQVIGELASRRGFLKTAAAFAGAVAGTELIGFDKALGFPASSDKVQDIINAALTAERLAVAFQYTALNTVLATTNTTTSNVLTALGTNLANVRIQIQTILDAERFHRDALIGLVATTLDSGSFFFPTGTFDNLTNYANTAVLLEQSFVGAYLVANAELNMMGYYDLAVIAHQFMGIEAEHRVLSRQLLGAVPASEIAQERYVFNSVGNTGNLANDSAVKTLLPFVTGGTGFSGYTVANGVATAATSGISEPADADINGANGTAGRTSIKPPAGPVVDPGV